MKEKKLPQQVLENLYVSFLSQKGTKTITIVGNGRKQWGPALKRGEELKMSGL